MAHLIRLNAVLSKVNILSHLTILKYSKFKSVENMIDYKIEKLIHLTGRSTELVNQLTEWYKQFKNLSDWSID